MFLSFSFSQFENFMEDLGSSLNFIISTAHAQSIPFLDRELISFAPIVFVFLLMYFLILRPQSKRAKQHRDMLSSLRRGDRVLTAGGIIGTIHKIENNEEISVEIAENVKVRVAKSTLTQVLTHLEPLKVSETQLMSSSDKSKFSKEKELLNSKKLSEKSEKVEIINPNLDEFVKNEAHSISINDKKSTVSRKSSSARKKPVSAPDFKN